MRYMPVNKSLFVRNRLKLAHRLQNKSLTIAVSNDLSIRSQDQFYPFRQNSDLFYLTGIEQPETTLVLFSEHESNLHEILFIKPLNPEWETWNGKLLTKEEASEISGIENVLYNTEFDEMIAELLNDCDVILLNYNDKPTSDLAQFLQPNRIKQKLQETHPHIAFEPLSLIINEIRTIKEQAEIELINKACEITGKAFREIVKHIKPNITEFEIEAIILSEFIKNRAIQAFNTIVASGKNACTLHYTDNNGICTEGELVLIDFGADYVYYASDCTRTLPVNGKFSPRQKEVYQAVLRILKAITLLIEPGKTIAELNTHAGLLCQEECIKLGILTHEEIQNQNPEKPAYKKFFMHGVSHFMGIDVHDVGRKTEILKPGMIITCEPGIYIANESIGVRLENDILITENGNLNLLSDIPVEIDEIESLFL